MYIGHQSREHTDCAPVQFLTQSPLEGCRFDDKRLSLSEFRDWQRQLPYLARICRDQTMPQDVIIADVVLDVAKPVAHKDTTLLIQDTFTSYRTQSTVANTFVRTRLYAGDRLMYSVDTQPLDTHYEKDHLEHDPKFGSIYFARVLAMLWNETPHSNCSGKTAVEHSINRLYAVQEIFDILPEEGVEKAITTVFWRFKIAAAGQKSETTWRNLILPDHKIASVPETAIDTKKELAFTSTGELSTAEFADSMLDIFSQNLDLQNAAFWDYNCVQNGVSVGYAMASADTSDMRSSDSSQTACGSTNATPGLPEGRSRLSCGVAAPMSYMPADLDEQHYDPAIVRRGFSQGTNMQQAVTYTPVSGQTSFNLANGSMNENHSFENGQSQASRCGKSPLSLSEDSSIDCAAKSEQRSGHMLDASSGQPAHVGQHSCFLPQNGDFSPSQIQAMLHFWQQDESKAATEACQKATGGSQMSQTLGNIGKYQDPLDGPSAEYDSYDTYRRLLQIQPRPLAPYWPDEATQTEGHALQTMMQSDRHDHRHCHSTPPQNTSTAFGDLGELSVPPHAQELQTSQTADLGIERNQDSQASWYPANEQSQPAHKYPYTPPSAEVRAQGKAHEELAATGSRIILKSSEMDPWDLSMAQLRDETGQVNASWSSSNNADSSQGLMLQDWDWIEPVQGESLLGSHEDGAWDVIGATSAAPGGPDGLGEGNFYEGDGYLSSLWTSGGLPQSNSYANEAMCVVSRETGENSSSVPHLLPSAMED